MSVGRCGVDHYSDTVLTTVDTTSTVMPLSILDVDVVCHSTVSGVIVSVTLSSYVILYVILFDRSAVGHDGWAVALGIRPRGFESCRRVNFYLAIRLHRAITMVSRNFPITIRVFREYSIVSTLTGR